MKGKDNLGNSLRKPELLAPAGTAEAFAAALDAGADAIYVGLKELSARALARNFTLSELANLLEAAHSRDAKVLVAMNSLLKEDELDTAINRLAGLEALGADGVIIQDLGIWRLARRYFPSLPLHASTLLTVHNSPGVIQAHRMGFKRVVLAREMTIKEIEAAAAAAPIETEVFIHGALCFSYSGLCLFSSYFGGRSSMRGKCVQPCRRLYTWKGKRGRFFSMGDLSALDMVWDLAKAGVRSLKIEGRLRPASYVYNVVRAYRILLDARPGDQDALGSARDLLGKAMARPYTKGFLAGNVPADAIRPERTASTGTFTGKILRVTRDRELVLKSNAALSHGDKLRLVRRGRDEQESVRVTGAKKRGNEIIITTTGWKRGFDPKGALVFRVDVSPGDGQGDKRKKTLKKTRGALVAKALRMAEARSKDVSKFLASDLAKETGRPSSASPGIWAKFRGDAGRPLRGHSMPGKIILEMKEKNPHVPKARGGRKTGNVIWSLPPVIHEERIDRYEKALASLMERGFHCFQVSNIGHMVLLEKAKQRARVPAGFRLDVCGNYTQNILNSQSIRAARDLGVKTVHFSMETDMDNLKKALAPSSNIPVILTVFAFPPLFTTRMSHHSYQEKAPVLSQRGERFHWTHREGVGRLLPHIPFCALNQYDAIKKLGITGLVLDFSNRPRDVKIPRIPAWDARTLKKLLRGRAFNMNSGLA